ncbi:D-alanine--poly(phosphoribitol) ligase subunit 1 [Macrococcus hajekii]|uniref:D-alanine--poly(Phosphoribitol) ligase subunit 1 n=1 Tax=Macrococcus hajekii TaxID=198482 RepID=A0A4V3BEF2_9STAP|nr:D-alanine--poly(phosphoribitol) ligase subunit DltA [Macrococcus hajekii]TDM03495.1 D-alanine--poly(phosphoribitol) ligase subunit 1 [Macrococcus hajekii]GGA99326.1 D-alanine--poly(phosphoribitol) ligase subunit 1 [Macrococcus hajekii]
MDFLAQLAQHKKNKPTAISFIHREERMTYQELDEYSNGLASMIADSSKPIVVYGHMSKWMIIGMIAGLKAGTGYVPIDTSIPDERVEKIIQTIEPEYILTAETLNITCSAKQIQPGSWMTELKFNHINHPHDIAYTIFTSGSTGTPKGVAIQYKSLDGFIDWMLSLYDIPAENYWLNQAPLSFDLSVMAVYPALASGGTLVMIDKDMIKKPAEIHSQLIEHPISAWVSTPSFMEMGLLLPAFSQETYSNLRYFYFCGEALKHKTAAQLKNKFSDASIYNTYGPTEATVAVTGVKVTDDILDQYNPLPVGMPRPHTKLSLSPEGELLIHGDAVSAGYVKEPEKTAQQFFEDNGERVYRTGDKAELRDNLWFINGRIDYQIKLNGYRMELEEIEEQLTKIEHVRQAVVTPIEKNGRVQYLVASIVSDYEGDVTHHVKENLKNTLPEYMIPRKIRTVESLPMTPNGKVDRKQIKEAVS